MHVFFGATYYYLYGSLKTNGVRRKRNIEFKKSKAYVEPVTGMHLVYTDRMAMFNETCFRPLSALQHKFMKIGPIHDGYTRNGLRIAYEMCDSTKLERILELHGTVLGE
jgi:hypothetical protein